MNERNNIDSTSPSNIKFMQKLNEEFKIVWKRPQMEGFQLTQDTKNAN